jgi:hypothetical protein
VIAGRPDHARETGHERREREFEMCGRADVAGDNQPVLRIAAHRLQRLAIGAMRQVQVADREQLQDKLPI